MKSSGVFFTALFAIVIIACIYITQSGKDTKPIPVAMQDTPSPAPEKTSFSGTFEATTPCDSIKPPLPQIRIGTPCEMAIWHITFNPDSTYLLTASYGMTQQNSTGIKNGGTKITMQGRWSEDPATDSILLNTDSPQEPLLFRKISNELIHLSDSDKHMIVGHGGWSYTLNKTQ